MANLKEHLAEQDAITARYEAEHATATGLQFFADDAAALEYIRYEFLETLQDDLRRMEDEEFDVYEEIDREEMRARIADLESIMPRLMVKP